MDYRAARLAAQSSARAARDTAANERYLVVDHTDDGRLKVTRPHWAPGKFITVPFTSRSRLVQGATVRLSQTDGVLEVSDFSAYSSGPLPS